MGQEIDAIVKLVETWQLQRTEIFKRQAFNEGANASSLREFVEIQNRISRQLIRAFDREDPNFFSALNELAMNSNRMLEGGKVFVDGKDRTAEGA